MNKKTTVELEHILKHSRHYPVKYANMAHREYSKRLRNRGIKEELKKTFNNFNKKLAQ